MFTTPWIKFLINISEMKLSVDYSINAQSSNMYSAKNELKYIDYVTLILFSVFDQLYFKVLPIPLNIYTNGRKIPKVGYSISFYDKACLRHIM